MAYCNLDKAIYDGFLEASVPFLRVKSDSLCHVSLLVIKI